MYDSMVHFSQITAQAAQSMDGIRILMWFIFCDLNGAFVAPFIYFLYLMSV